MVPTKQLCRCHSTLLRINICKCVQCRRIQKCPGSVNPNCVSTSSTSELFAPAWRATSSSAAAALQDLEAEILGRHPDARKVGERDTEAGPYVAYAVPGRFGKPDLLEFLVKEEGVTDRGWEGDRAGPVVLYRSLAGAPLARQVASSGSVRCIADVHFAITAAVGKAAGPS